MPEKMRYRLALDLGAASLGWAMIRLNANNEPCAVIRAGVRIFSDGRNPKDGNSLAVTRRDARAMRRRRDRLLKRKARLHEALVRLGFFPPDVAAQKELQLLDPYALRAAGLERPLSGAEFARALFHINQRRGFASNRKAGNKDSDSGALKQAIKTLREKLLEENCRTLGQWLHIRHTQQLSVRARLHGKTQKDKRYDFYADRAMVADEFAILWQEQERHNPALFHPAARDELCDILLHQRPLRPVLPGRCTLLPDQPRAALALPSTQRFRIYQELNHLRILLPDLQEQTLTLAQRNTLAALLETQSNATFTAIVKALKLPGVTRFNLEDVKRDRLRGNATSVALSKPDMFGAKWADFAASFQDDIVSKLLDEASESVLVAWLRQNTGVDEAGAERIANISLPDGYGSLSVAALARIVPCLAAEVITYDKAVIKAGFDSHSQLSGQTGEIMPALPYYGSVLQRHVAFARENPRNEEERYGKIANPTVHIGLNQVRVVVNGLIAEYGHPSGVVIEVARDLKMSRERKLELMRDQKEKQDRNNRLVAEACHGLGGQNPDHLDKNTRRQYSQKMQLWYELNPKDVLARCCPYTGVPISLAQLLSAEVEIDHILPFSKTLDDSMSNKTVALSRANRFKGNRTPYEAFGRDPDSAYDYAAILQRVALMPAAKRVRFAEDGLARALKGDEFLARALNDTAYLSRIAREYLICICPDERNINAIPGRMTGMLRGKFGLNAFLSGNHEKNREDHRHHALDAMVIGITDRAMLKKFADASASAREQALDRLVSTVEEPWPGYRSHVQRALAAIWVSHRPDHGYQGSFMEDTAWGLMADGRVTRKVRPEGGGSRVRQEESKKVIPVFAAAQAARHGVDADGNSKAYKGYVGGSNYCIEIYCDARGRWEGDVISTYQAYQVVRELGETAGWQRLRDPALTQSGQPLAMRLMIADYVRFEHEGVLRTMVIATISGNGQIFMFEHNEGNVDARNRDKTNPFGYISKRPGSLQKAKGRRCTVSPTGRLRDPGFKG